MIPKEERYTYAIQKFLIANPTLQNELNQLDPNTAQNLGVTLVEYRECKLSEEFTDHAKAIGKDITDLIIDLCAKNEIDRQAMILEDLRDRASSLGVEWEDYKALNGL